MVSFEAQSVECAVWRSQWYLTENISNGNNVLCVLESTQWVALRMCSDLKELRGTPQLNEQTSPTANLPSFISQVSEFT